MQLTVKSVSPTARDWGSKYPDACSVKVWFDDGTCGEYNTKKDKAQSHIDALSALVGKPGEFEVTREREYDGVTERTFKAYPGKVESKSFGGSKGNYVPAFHQTAEGMAYEQEGLDRRTALMQAIQFCNPGSPSETRLAYADEFYTWLRSKCPSLPVSTPNAEIPASSPATPQNVTKQSGNGTPVALAAEIWNGPGQCPICHCPPEKRHGDKCLKGSHEED